MLSRVANKDSKPLNVQTELLYSLSLDHVTVLKWFRSVSAKQRGTHYTWLNTKRVFHEKVSFLWGLGTLGLLTQTPLDNKCANLPKRCLNEHNLSSTNININENWTVIKWDIKNELVSYRVIHSEPVHLVCYSLFIYYLCIFYLYII